MNVNAGHSRTNTTGLEPIQFLCRALRGEPTPWTALYDLEGDEFLEHCRHHGVMALLYHRMHERNEWGGWPLEVREALEQASKAGVAKELLCAHYLRQLLGKFAGQGISCILTKGAALAVTLYPEPGTRTRSDSDLFIRIGDIGRARQTVLDLGYRIASPVYKTHQFTVVRPGDESLIIRFDIHWRILNSPRFARSLSFEEAYQNSVEFPDMAPARMLNRADALMLACMHRFGSERHDRDRLIWISDIQALIAAMDHSELMQFASRAVERNVQDVCLDGVKRSIEYLGSDVPEQVLEVLSSPELQPPLSVRWSKSYLGLVLDDLKKLPGRTERFEMVSELFLPSSQYLLRKYSKNNRLWLPLLHIRQLVVGIWDRLLLR